MSRTGTISDAAVKRATGRGWDAWVRVLDRAGGKALEHKALVKKVAAYRGVSGWWSQMIAVEYERRRGKRRLGQTAGAGYQIGVTKTVPLSKKQAWDLVMSRPGKKLWKGRGVKTTPRTRKVGTRVRMTWESPLLKRPSVLQINITPRQSTRGTCIGFHQEKLSSAAERGKMKRHWKKVVARLEEMVVA